MLAIEMLPAGHGDALVVEYGTRAETHRILIDAGTRDTWPTCGRLVTMPDDRVRGVRRHARRRGPHRRRRGAAGRPDLRNRVGHVWFNGYVHCKRAATCSARSTASG